MVDGLQANQTALTQSETNAREGVGLLQVADGALSQVTSLLNRAVTLATEASNGTLNHSQDTAANQEYQSILSEINNIGSTTTYNQKTVFGNTGNNAYNIYVGDSSASGASIDSLSIGGLSDSKVGETAGTMNYDQSQSVVVDLGSATATTNTAFNGANASTLTFTNATGTVTTVNLSANENVGNSIQAINSANMGLTASFVAGNAATSTDAFLVISGNVEEGGPESGSELKAAVATGALAGTFASANGTNGTAEITYSATAGADLSSTKLDNQADAEGALTSLNAAITDVAAQDGYIGAQINTLNCCQPGHLDAAGKRAVGAERRAGHRLRAGQLQHVQVRNPEPDRHLGPGAGQQRAAGSDQAAAVIGVPGGRWLERAGAGGAH